MSAVLIKDLSCILHERLKQEAQANHRSLNKEIIWRLEQTVANRHKMRTLGEVAPVKPLKPIRADFFTKVIRAARDSR